MAADIITTPPATGETDGIHPDPKNDHGEGVGLIWHGLQGEPGVLSMAAFFWAAPSPGLSSISLNKTRSLLGFRLALR